MIFLTAVLPTSLILLYIIRAVIMRARAKKRSWETKIVDFQKSRDKYCVAVHFTSGEGIVSSPFLPKSEFIEGTPSVKSSKDLVMECTERFHTEKFIEIEGVLYMKNTISKVEILKCMY